MTILKLAWSQDSSIDFIIPQVKSWISGHILCMWYVSLMVAHEMEIVKNLNWLSDIQHMAKSNRIKYLDSTLTKVRRYWKYFLDLDLKKTIFIGWLGLQSLPHRCSCNFLVVKQIIYKTTSRTFFTMHFISDSR